ncbi:CPBP family intramembrane glutamic endopeptidase [Stomatohabitans albus]|uniref:CPBP family intramembrane glutamic endopeptidase n=1 Tax=Stomatohabitans albus TaxID=3110766 RepID=UPI00300D7B7C
MPISERFTNTDEPEWSWGDPSHTDVRGEGSPSHPEAVSTADSTPVPEVIGNPWLDVVMGIVIFAVAQLVIGLIATIVYAVVTKADLTALRQNDPNMLISVIWPVSISTILMAWWWSYRGNRTPATFMKWSFKKTDLLWGVGATLISIATGVVLSSVFQLSPEDSANLNSAIWPSDISPLQAIGAGLAIGIVVPIAEEMIFRGIILNALSRKVNTWVALVISALLFTVPHLPNFLLIDIEPAAMLSGIIQILILGLVIGFWMIKTNRLGASIWAHIMNNSMVVISLVLGQMLP